MYFVSSFSCLGPFHWSHVLGREWRCSWRCSNYIWMINNFIAYLSATYIRGSNATHLWYRSSLSHIQSAWRLQSPATRLLFNSLFRLATNETTMHQDIPRGSPGIWGFALQNVSNAERVSISWRRRESVVVSHQIYRAKWNISSEIPWERYLWPVVVRAS